MAILEVSHLSKHFGGLKAVHDLTFKVTEGHIMGIIGPNGAGKTTVFNCLTGIYPVTHGEIRFLGERIENLRPYQIAQKGLVKTFQANRIFPKLTIWENILIGSETSIDHKPRIPFWNRSEAQARRRQAAQKVEEILTFIGLYHEKDNLAKNLPHGSQRKLAVGITLATSPRLLLLDEPATGMNSEEKQEMLHLIAKIKERGIHVLLIEHDMKLVMNICDHLLVLNYGEKIAEGKPQEISQNEAVIAAYLGRKGTRC